MSDGPAEEIFEKAIANIPLQDFIKKWKLDERGTNLKESFYRPTKPSSMSYKEMSEKQRMKWEQESKGK